MPSKFSSNFCSNNFFKRELLESIIEITTDVCNDVDEIYNDVSTKNDMAIEFSNDNNFELLFKAHSSICKSLHQKISVDDKDESRENIAMNYKRKRYYIL